MSPCKSNDLDTITQQTLAIFPKMKIKANCTFLLKTVFETFFFKMLSFEDRVTMESSANGYKHSKFLM